MKRMKLMKIGMVSASSLLLLAACGDGGTGTETPPAEESTVTDTTGMEDTTAPATEDTSQDTTQDTSQDGGAIGNDQTENVEQGINNMDFATSLDDAIQTFNDEFNSPNIESIQFDEDDGRYTYEFEGFDDSNEYQMDIDAQRGEILERERDDEDDEDDDILELENIVMPDEAMSTALEEAGSGYVENWELDVEDGVTVYEIDLEDADDDDIYVNAQTGEIYER